MGEEVNRQFVGVKAVPAALCALVMFVAAFVMMPSAASAASGDTVTISGNVYAFFGIDDVIPGSVIKVDEFPALSANVGPDGTYAIEVPDDANVTPYIVTPAGYRDTYLQTFHTAGQDLIHVNFQVTMDAHYLAFSAILGVPLDDNKVIKECVIVSTFSITAARDATTFDPGFKNVYPHGLENSTATIDPAGQGNTKGPVYFSSSVIPTPGQTSSSVDGGVLWTEVPPGWYHLTPSNPTSNVAPFTAHCENGRLINASPPWGFYELHNGEAPNPAVLSDAPPVVVPDTSVSATAAKKAVVVRKGKSRTIKLNLSAGEAVKARLSANRGIGATKLLSLPAGKHVLKIPVARNVAAGPVKLTLTLNDETGNELTVKRQARLPRLPVVKKHHQ